MPSRTPRRSQSDRRGETRAKLLTAAIECLLADGYAATSISTIQARSGVGRGTVQHHFPTKAELIVAATAQLVEERIASTGEAAARIDPGVDRLDALVDLVWQDLSSPAFLSVLELWVAARTDRELREALLPHERRLMSATAHTFLAVLGDDLGGDPRAATYVEFTIDVFTGLVMTTLLSAGAGNQERMRKRWRAALGVLFASEMPH